MGNILTRVIIHRGERKVVPESYAFSLVTKGKATYADVDEPDIGRTAPVETAERAVRGETTEVRPPAKRRTTNAAPGRGNRRRS